MIDSSHPNGHVAPAVLEKNNSSLCTVSNGNNIFNFKLTLKWMLMLNRYTNMSSSTNTLLQLFRYDTC